MPQKLPVKGFKWIEDLSEFDEGFLKCFNGKSREGNLLDINIENPEKLDELHNDLPFLPKKIKIEIAEEPVANFFGKNEYVIHIRNLKQASNHGLVLKKVHKVVKFNQKAWLKLYIEMNTGSK